MVVLNRIVRAVPEERSAELEPDLRHAELAIKELYPMYVDAQGTNSIPVQQVSDP